MDRGYMIAKRNRRSPYLFLVACWMASATAFGQAPVAPPQGYAAGWWIDVYKAGSDLDHPEGDRLGGFAAPAAGFDMASYRDAIPNRLDFGIAYTANGLLDVKAAGQHKLVLNAGWTSESGAAEAHCAFALAIDGTRVSAAQATVTEQADHTVADGPADLQPGLHPAELRVACDRPLGARFVIAASIKAPGDEDPRPLGPVDIVHPTGQSQTAEAGAPAAPGAPSPAPAPSGGPAQPSEGARTMIAVIDMTVREQPSNRAKQVGHLVAGQQVEIAGPAEEPGWVALAAGGYVEAGFLKAQGDAGPARPAASHGGYKVGDCYTYSARSPYWPFAGPVRHRACLKSDGRWHVVR
jgi:hypothetical protein